MRAVQCFEGDGVEPPGWIVVRVARDPWGSMREYLVERGEYPLWSDRRDTSLMMSKRDAGYLARAFAGENRYHEFEAELY